LLMQTDRQIDVAKLRVAFRSEAKAPKKMGLAVLKFHTLRYLREHNYVLEKIMKDQDVKKSTKIKIAETVIFPAVTYGSESWTVRKRERKKIDAFELWTWRKILRVPWTEKRTNFSVLEEVKHKRSLEATILPLN